MRQFQIAIPEGPGMCLFHWRGGGGGDWSNQVRWGGASDPKMPYSHRGGQRKGAPTTRGMTAVQFWGLLDSRSQLLEASDMCDAQFIRSPREQGIHHPRILG